MGYKVKEIMLLGAGFTTKNMGVWALASGAINCALSAYPDAKIYFLDYHSQTESYPIKKSRDTSMVQLINIRFSKKIWLQNNIAYLLLIAFLTKICPSWKFRKRLSSSNLVFQHIQSADIIGSIAGGDSFSDIYGLRRLIYVSLPQILVLIMGKPLVLLPQTIGPFNGVWAKLIALYILKRAKVVYSRDNDSLQTVRSLLGQNFVRIETCYDLGFVLDPCIVNEKIPPSIAKMERDVPLIGVNVSGLLYMGGYTRRNMFGLKVNYPRLIHELIELFIKKYNAQIMLVPHVFGSGKNSESDVQACREVFNRTENNLQPYLHLIEDEYDQHEIKALIGRCDFFIGSRMHACIGALSQCIPAVGLAYSRKFRGVFASIGMTELVIDLREDDESSVIALIDGIYQRRQELHRQLEAKMAAVQASVLDLFCRHSNEIDREKGCSHDGLNSMTGGADV